MRILALIISAVILSSTSFSAEKPEYAIDKIPDALKSKANAVIRNRVLVITVLANGTAEENCHTVISILNKNGEDYGVFTEFYNKFSSISNLEGAVYDEKGKRIEKLSDDFNDFSAISGFSLYEDNRVKFCRTKLLIIPLQLSTATKDVTKVSLYYQDSCPTPAITLPLNHHPIPLSSQIWEMKKL